MPANININCKNSLKNKIIPITLTLGYLGHRSTGVKKGKQIDVELGCSDCIDVNAVADRSGSAVRFTR